MKGIISHLGIGVLSAMLFTVLMPEAVVAAVSPSDYDVPESTAQQLRLGGSYSYAGSGSDVLTNDGSASVLYNRFYNSLPYAWDVTINGLALTRRTITDEQKGAYNFIVAPSVRKYFNPDGALFYSGDLRMTGNSDFDRPSIDVTPGLGYGRFVRVTPLAQAVRIETFLLQEGVIKKALPRKTMVALAQLIERRAEYEAEHGATYKTVWYKDMENVIAKSGTFAHSGLGAAGTLRVEEVLFEENVNERFIGWDARAGVRFEALTPGSNIDRQDPSLSVRLRYSRPVSWRSQFDVDGQYTSPFSGDFGADVFTATGTVNYLYEVTNRIDFTLSNIVTASKSNPNTEALIIEQVRTGFIFFIENQINLAVTGNLSKERHEDTNQGLNLAVEYRLR